MNPRVTAALPKMLVVDDQPLNIRILHELFRDQFEVFMATSGAEALAKCRGLLPDLLLLDIAMPEMDGFEVCRQIKADPLLANIPVVFVTSHYDEREEANGFLVGAADFIRKPINPVITRARVKNHLLTKQQADSLRSSALLDGLTGIANRRLFDESLAVALLQSARDRVPLTVILLDVDFFKQYNDHYGHFAGDQALRQVAGALRGVLARPYDLVARYGGEEFIALAPRTDVAGGAHLAQRMVDQVRELALEHRDSAAGLVTISAGAVSAVPERGCGPDRFLEAADRLLYEAKKAGRARVCAAQL